MKRSIFICALLLPWMISESGCRRPVDACRMLVCEGPEGPCRIEPRPDGTRCDDDNACTRTDVCRSGACIGADPVVCTALDSCHEAGTCAPATGECSSPVRPDGSSCTDGNKCTQTDTCERGVCIGANPKSCPAESDCQPAQTCDRNTGTCSLGGGGRVWSGTYRITDAASVKTLEPYTRIEGGLQIDSSATATSVVLPNLESIGGPIYLHQSKVTTFEVPKLTKLGGVFGFHQNNDLTSIDASALTGLCGDVYFQENNAITNPRLQRLAHVGGILYFYQNRSLATIDLPALKTVGKYIYVNGNSVLASFDAPNVETVGESATFYNIPISQLDLGKLKTIGGNFELHGTAVQTVNISSLTKVSGFFYVNSNPALSTIGPSALQQIGGYLYFGQNGLLNAINFGSLSSVGGYIYVARNGLLRLGLPSLVTIAGDANVFDNTSLPTSCVDALQRQLIGFSGTFNNSGNGTGPCPP